MKQKYQPDHHLWQEIIGQAEQTSQEDHSSKVLMGEYILKNSDFHIALSRIILDRLNPLSLMQDDLEAHFQTILQQDDIKTNCLQDLIATYERDPACHTPLFPLLFYKGFHALVVYRVAHKLWNDNRRTLALYLQSLTSSIFTIDIHPAAKIAGSTFIDHGHSIVIGETCVIKCGVSILQDVTLGGTGKEFGDRHPKIEEGVLIGAGAKVLGNITIGRCSKIGASSVVLKDIPPHSVAVGIPAKVVDQITSTPAETMDHSLD